MMDCSQFQEILPDLDRSGVMEAELREQALMHAEACSDCAQLLTETESLDADLQCLSLRDADLQAPARVETHLLHEFRARKAVDARARAWRYAAWLGIAAMALLLLGLWMYRRSTGSIRAPIAQKEKLQSAGAPNLQASNTQASTPTISLRSPVTAATEPGAAPKPVNGRAQSASDQSSDAESAAFIPLPYADDPAALDDGAIVRVVMPREALASFGLPVAAMEGDGTVRADLIVSEDGTPQAIRLISQDETSGSMQR